MTTRKEDVELLKIILEEMRDKSRHTAHRDGTRSFRFPVASLSITQIFLEELLDIKKGNPGRS